jgi:hypothetical protein
VALSADRIRELDNRAVEKSPPAALVNTARGDGLTALAIFSSLDIPAFEEKLQARDSLA